MPIANSNASKRLWSDSKHHFNPILINGYFGAPELGIAEAAIVTGITLGISAVITLYLLLRGVAGLKTKCIT